MEDFRKEYINRLYKYADSLIGAAHKDGDPMLHEQALQVQDYARRLENGRL